jgi:anti-anti-sigma factor
MKQPFKVTIKDENDIAIVKLSGELLTDNVQDLNKALQKTLDKTSQIIIDISELVYICSAGMGTLIATHNKAVQTSGGELVILGLNEKVQRVFNSVGFARFMKFADSLKEAKAIFEKG